MSDIYCDDITLETAKKLTEILQIGEDELETRNKNKES